MIRKVLSTEKNPIVENGPGHGCGHHLFRTASTAAAIAVNSKRVGPISSTSLFSATASRLWTIASKP